MEGDKILMSQRQLQRWHLMGLVEGGKITLKEAGEKLGVSYRQAKRIWRTVKRRGVRGVIHGNAGRHPPNRISEQVREQVLKLSREDYEKFNDTHFTEMLVEREEMVLSRETVRKWRREAGIEPKRKRRSPKHRKRRERMAQEGAMVLWDGSPHPWFGSKYPPCCLMAAMDDARGKLLAARFFTFEGSVGYLWLLEQLVLSYGVPGTIYQDRHGALHRNDSYWSLEEQLAGRQEPTQVGLALEALGIRPLFALSPQAKGRVEKLFATLQDRLGAELGLEGITTLEQANRFLKRFVRRFNRRFALPAEQVETAWRVAPKNLDRIISFRYHATVGNDNTVRLGGLLIDIPPGPGQRSYAKARVEVRQLLTGAWQLYYQDQLIAKHAPTPLREPEKVLPRKKPSAPGASSRDWVYLASAPPKEQDMAPARSL